MMNKIFREKKFPTIKVGIGLAASKTLVIKAGVRGSETGMNDKIWIGDSVSFASKLSQEAGRNHKDNIISTSIFYSNLNEKNKNFFRQTYSQKLNCGVYQCDVIKIEMNNWIKNDFSNK